MTEAAGWSPGERERRELVEAGQTVLANLRTDRELVRWARDAGRFVYIGRAVPRQRLPGSKWRNPARVEAQAGESVEARHRAAVAAYGRHLAEHPELVAAVEELRGIVLGCWCHPLPCHGEALLERLRAAE